MSNDIKKKTVSGFAYKFAERVGAQGINFIVQIILARILLTDEYGLIALVTVFITICDVFVTYGFGNSLIVNKQSDSLDFSTCFYFGLVLAVVLYTAVYFATPFIAAYYKKFDYDLLVPVIRVMAEGMDSQKIESVANRIAGVVRDRLA